ncbi:MAG: isoprenylcysteine carboxylmethyltransferase family protein [Pseudomonadota bacterium]
MKWIDLPPVWLIAAMAVMWVLAEIVPFPDMDILRGQTLGRALIAVAIAIMIWAAITMRRHRTTIVPHLQPSALVTDGPFRFSRNPIYAADVLILIGWAVSLGALVPLIIIPVFVKVIEIRFILPEEARLTAGFGDTFVEWCKVTGRWF